MLVQAKKLARLAGWLAIGSIIILSLLPGDERPHTGTSGHFEHVAAYLIAAALLAFAYSLRRSLTLVVVALPALSGLMEILQIFIPGRHAGFDDFAASSLGVIIGVALTLVFLRYCRAA